MLYISFTYSILKKRKPNTSNSYLSPPANLTAKLLWPVTPHWGLNGPSLPHLTYQCIRHSWSLSLNHLLFLATRHSPCLLCIFPRQLPCRGLSCFPHLISLTCKDRSAQARSPCVSSGFCLNSVSRWSHDFKYDLNASDARISVSFLGSFLRPQERPTYFDYLLDIVTWLSNGHLTLNMTKRSSCCSHRMLLPFSSSPVIIPFL